MHRAPSPSPPPPPPPAWLNDGAWPYPHMPSVIGIRGDRVRVWDDHRGRAVVLPRGHLAHIAHYLHATMLDDQGKEDLAGVVANLACDLENRRGLADAGAIPALVRQLTVGRPHNHKRTLRALANLAWAAPENQREIAATGGVGALLGVLGDPSRGPRELEEAAAALGNVLGHEEVAQSVRVSPAGDELRHLATTGTETQRAHAAWLLGKITDVAPQAPRQPKPESQDTSSARRRPARPQLRAYMAPPIRQHEPMARPRVQAAIRAELVSPTPTTYGNGIVKTTTTHNGDGVLSADARVAKSERFVRALAKQESDELLYQAVAVEPPTRVRNHSLQSKQVSPEAVSTRGARNADDGVFTIDGLNGSEHDVRSPLQRDGREDGNDDNRTFFPDEELDETYHTRHSDGSGASDPSGLYVSRAKCYEDIGIRCGEMADDQQDAFFRSGHNYERHAAGPQSSEVDHFTTIQHSPNLSGSSKSVEGDQHTLETSQHCNTSAEADLIPQEQGNLSHHHRHGHNTCNGSTSAEAVTRSHGIDNSHHRGFHVDGRPGASNFDDRQAHGASVNGVAVHTDREHPATQFAGTLPVEIDAQQRGTSTSQSQSIGHNHSQGHTAPVSPLDMGIGIPTRQRGHSQGQLKRTLGGALGEGSYSQHDSLSQSLPISRSPMGLQQHSSLDQSFSHSRKHGRRSSLNGQTDAPVVNRSRRHSRRGSQGTLSAPNSYQEEHSSFWRKSLESRNSASDDLPVADIPALVQLLDSEIPEYAERAVSVLRKLSNDADNKSKIVVAGAIEPLIQSVQAGSARERVEAAWTLGNLAWNSFSQAQIASAGAIPPLIDLLKANRVREREGAAWALRNLACNTENRAKIGAANGIPSLVSSLRSTSMCEKVHAGAALKSLACNVENQAMIAAAGAIPILISDLTGCHEGQLLQAVATLRNLSRQNAHNQAHIIRSGGIRPLVLLVASGTRSQQIHAAATLANLASTTEAQLDIVAEGVVPSVLKLIDEDDADLLEATCLLVRNLVWKNETNQDRIATCGALRRIVVLLGNKSNGVRKQAAAVLRNVAWNSSMNQQAIADARAIPPLVSLAKTGTTAQREHAAAALANLSWCNVNVQERISRLGGIAILTELASTGNDAHRKQAMSVIRNLIFNDQKKVQAAVPGVIPGFVALLVNGSSRQRQHGTWALANLACNSKNKDEMVSAGSIRPLVAMATEGPDSQKQYAASALANLACNDEHKTKILVVGGVAPLIDLVADGTEGQKKQAAWALRNLAWSCRESQITIAKAGGIPPLIRMINDGSETQKEHAAAALSNLACEDSNLSLIVTEGGIKAFVSLLATGTDRQREQAAWGLANLAAAPNNRDRIVAAGGLTVLEGLVSQGTPEQRQGARTAIARIREGIRHMPTRKDLKVRPTTSGRNQPPAI